MLIQHTGTHPSLYYNKSFHHFSVHGCGLGLGSLDTYPVKADQKADQNGRRKMRPQGSHCDIWTWWSLSFSGPVTSGDCFWKGFEGQALTEQSCLLFRRKQGQRVFTRILIHVALLFWYFMKKIYVLTDMFSGEIRKVLLEAEKEAAKFFWQIYLSVLTNTFCICKNTFQNTEKYILQFCQIPFPIWTNTIWNLDKYNLNFGQIHHAEAPVKSDNSDKYNLKFRISDSLQ